MQFIIEIFIKTFFVEQIHFFPSNHVHVFPITFKV